MLTIKRHPAIFAAYVALMLGIIIGASLATAGMASAQPADDNPAQRAWLAQFKGGWAPCLSDEGESTFRCVWDARHMGNSTGDSFKITGGDNVHVISHRQAHRLLAVTDDGIPVLTRNCDRYQRAFDEQTFYPLSVFVAVGNDHDWLVVQWSGDGTRFIRWYWVDCAERLS